MSAHNALTSRDIEVLFAAAEGDGPVVVVECVDGVTVETAGQVFPQVGRAGLERLKACGYLDGGPDTFAITPRGREYADSMR